MDVYYKGKALKALNGKIEFVRGRGAKTLADGIAKQVREGNRRDRLAGVDRYGISIASYAPLKGPRKGEYKGKTGPILAPSRTKSRIIANFFAFASRRGGKWTIFAGWANVLSKKGVPFLPFHDSGTATLPRRAHFGLSPQTWAIIRPMIADFKRRVIQTS